MTTHLGFRPALLAGALSFSRSDYQTSEREASTPEEGETEEHSAVLGRAATLPTEVIQQIFNLVDPETFSSLVLVNRAWRKAAEAPEIYAYQVSRCPSFAAAHNALAGPFKEEDLPGLKRQLVQEVKRNLFAPFLRPEQTIVNIISTTTSSSAAFPHGEGFEFIFSYRAQYCLAMSSGRIIVIDTASDTPKVTHELKVVRRPLSACILADGSLLAVLAANHRVNLYDLTCDPVMFKRSVELDEIAHTITMTTAGEVLAAGSETGVEVVSLAERGPHTAKRVIKCDRVDSLSFSADGMMLLGTTQASRTPSTVILTAPYFSEYSEHEMDRAELLSHLWTSQIIFPNSSRDCSHAALLPRSQDHDANWTLAYDRVFESFRAVRTDDLRNGTTYFTGPEPNAGSNAQPTENVNKDERRRNRRSKNSFTPKSLPAITPKGELVAAPFLTSDIWLYGVPEDLARPGIPFGTEGAGSPEGSRPSSSLRPRSEINRMPRWQLLVDKYRNVFAKGRKVASVTGASSMCWCSDDPHAPNARQRDRLVIAAPGGVSDCSNLEEEEIAAVDGGRIVVLDFALGSKGGTLNEITIEVGNTEPQLLEEENIDLDEEIATVRRRTLARQSGVSRLTISSVADILRAGHDNAPPVPPVPDGPGFGLDRSGTDETQLSESTTAAATESADEGVSLEEAMEGLDGPYSQSSPRSRGVVYRSAAAVEANRRRNPPNPVARSTPEPRRTDGSEMPHESDADNWVPPPPAYGKHVDDIRRSVIAQEAKTSPGDGPVSPVAAEHSTTRRMVPDDPLNPSTKATRRRSADVDASRWFSRHEHNRSEPPSLGSSTAEASVQRSHSQRAATLRDTLSPTLRHPGAFATRTAAYRTALRPPTAILSPPDSTAEHDVSPMDIAAGSDPSIRRAYFDSAAAESRSKHKALAPKQQWPMTLDDGRPVVPPKDSPRHATHSSLDSNATSSRPSIPRKPVEASAYQSTAASMPLPESSSSVEQPKKSPLAPIAKLGAAAVSRVRAQSPPPGRPSVTRSASARAPQLRASLEPGNTGGPSPLPRTRRSMRFGRKRPKTEDPAVLAAAASMMPGASAAANAPATPEMPSAHHMADLTSRRGRRWGWDREARAGAPPLGPLYEVSTSAPGRRASVRRALGSVSRSPPGAPAGGRLAQSSLPEARPGGERKKGRMQGGGKCTIM